MPQNDLHGTRTHAALKQAFAQDAQATRLYVELARLAELDGARDLAATLREVAETHAMLAGGHLDLLRRVGDPLLNGPLEGADQIRAAVLRLIEVDGPDLREAAQTADAEGFFDIASWLESVARTRRHHRARLSPEQP